MKAGFLYINDKPLPRKRIEDYLYHEPGGAIIPLAQYIETLPNGRQHPIIKLGDNGPLDNTQIYEVPPGEYFAMATIVTTRRTAACFRRSVLSRRKIWSGGRSSSSFRRRLGPTVAAGVLEMAVCDSLQPAIPRRELRLGPGSNCLRLNSRQSSATSSPDPSSWMRP